MKKIYFIILATMLFTGCEDMFYKEYSYHWDFPETVNNERDIYEILTREEYNYRYDKHDEWNLPQETYENTSYGMDCEDMAFFAVYLYHECLGVNDVQAVAYHDTKRGGNHMMYKVNGVVYQSTGGARGEPVTRFYMSTMEKLVDWDYDEMITHIYRHKRQRTATDNEVIYE